MASPALAGEPHPKIAEFGHNATEAFSNPNGIAVQESTGDVYVADIGTDTVYKFDANGNPLNFASLGSNTLTGTATEAKSFSFPSLYGNPAAIAVDNSTSPSDPSAGDLYVMDGGHDAIDKFSPSGEYLSQIGGLPPVTSGANGEPEGELLGLGVDGSGTVHVDLSTETSDYLLIDEFDSAAVNIARQKWHAQNEPADGSGVPFEANKAHGFAVSATGDDYQIYEPSCSCTVKFGQKLSPLGGVDGVGAGDVAVAVDPATGHLYADDQSSVAEWDTGAMNRNSVAGHRTSGTLVARFGSVELSGTSGQGGIAVDGATGDVYVSNPANGKVYVFGSDPPAVTAGEPADVTREAASLSGTVDPRGVAVSSCEFEYGLTDEFGNGPYNHSVPCKQTPAEIEAGSGPVAVSAQLEGLQAGELYHFHLVATNANGAGEGSGMLATRGVGFGIKNYEISFLNEDGTPDTQAGSHPYHFVNIFELNSHFKRSESNADSPYIRLPDGVLRDVTLDLPPGFVGDPNATPQKCTGQELRAYGCLPESEVGHLYLQWSKAQVRAPAFDAVLFNMTPVRGVALQLGTNFLIPLLYINNGVLAGGDYPAQATVTAAPGTAPVIKSEAVISGVVGKIEEPVKGIPHDARKPFLTMPTGCHGPLRSTIAADSWQEPGQWATKSTVTHNAAGTPVSLTGCSKLKFPPEISMKPDTTDASTSSGLTVNVHVPQNAAFNPTGLAESALRDTTVTLPQGVAINPSGGDGLEACTSEPAALGGALGSPGDQVGYKGQEELNAEYEPGVKWSTFTPELASPLAPGTNFCPDGSKVGTVKIKTPLLEHELEGAVYLAAQNNNPFGSLVAMYLVVEDPYSGTLVKLAGEVSLNPQTGQIVTTFKNTPDLPFENLELHFFGGERAPLATPSRCGTYTTTAVFTPWDGNGPVTSESSFNIEHGPGGGPCPGASLPFSPTVSAGATNIQAGAFSPLTVTMNRKDGEQNLKSIEAKLPPGLSGVLTGVELCPEPRANEGLCGENSKVGEATISVGVGNQPFTVTGGKFYLTGPYNGSGTCTVGQPGCAPFGLTFEVPAKAGPFDLKRNSANPASENACDCVIVRGKIELDPLTSAITITTDPPGSPYSIPTSIEGIPLEIQHVNATTTRGNFQFNPTSCAKMALTGTLLLSEGGTSTISTPFQVTNCAVLGFKPGFKVSTSGKTSRSKGASLTAKLTYPMAPFGSQANIARVKVDLPKQLPSRLTTLQKACTAAQFNANPAGCPAASFIGHAKAITPILPVPLEGPAIFVSHGGEAFPSLIVVLQGYGVTIDLVGSTFISKAGITSSTFKTVPDQPVTSFELTLPEGKYSALAANGNLCASTKTVTVSKRVTRRIHGRTRRVTVKVKKSVAAPLAMPTEFVAQNGAVIHQSTPISVTGCAKAAKAKKKVRMKKGKKK
jgi:DNA-binding beta-propeller fold protein YncE